jgi:hypothetical protein
MPDTEAQCYEYHSQPMGPITEFISNINPVSLTLFITLRVSAWSSYRSALSSR